MTNQEMWDKCSQQARELVSNGYNSEQVANMSKDELAEILDDKSILTLQNISNAKIDSNRDNGKPRNERYYDFLVRTHQVNECETFNYYISMLEYHVACALRK